MWLRSLAVAAVVGLAAGPALAQAVQQVSVRILVTHASPQPGPIDPEAAGLHDQLRRNIRYQSLRVLQRQRLQLDMDEIGTLQLPNGRWMRIRPINQAGNRLLMAVKVDGAIDTDLRLRNQRPVSIGSHRYKDGTLVITFESEF